LLDKEVQCFEIFGFEQDREDQAVEAVAFDDD
jgi:hypothetical protein